jgi:phospholipid transport system substrate-binding protein
MRTLTLATTLLIGTLLSSPHMTPARAEELASVATENNSALDEIKTTIDAVVTVNIEFSGEKNRVARRDKLRDIVAPRFDFEEMSRRSLGSNWNTINAEEQTQFVTLFSELLSKTYIARIEMAGRDTVTIGSETVELPKSYIKTMVNYKGDKFPIDYKLIQHNGDWRVYDVLIENIGLVGNYRNEFAGILRKDGIKGLLSMLEEKIKKLG